MEKKNNNPLFVVWGGQMGSEGKGELVARLVQDFSIKYGVRVGGPNAGHTYHIDGQKTVVQTVPIVAMMGGEGIIGPAGMFLVDILKEEMEKGYELLGRPVKLTIDYNAAVITRAHMAQEAHLKGSIGSTGEGVGAATAAKVMRDPAVVVNSQVGSLHLELEGPAFSDLSFGETSEMLNREAYLGRVTGAALLEGTQGYGLSLHTGGFYPKCTSRECTPQALIAETGINPALWKETISVMVVRTFPIRVGGNSGPLANEIDWDILREETGGYVNTPEITTVTKKVRRIARIDTQLLQRAVLQCSPSYIALTFFDYVFPALAGVTDAKNIGFEHWRYLESLENILGVKIGYVATGPGSIIKLI